MRVLLITPPMVQMNTPYPGTAYLLGHLDRLKREGGLPPSARGEWHFSQVDASLKLALKLFSRAGLSQIYMHLSDNKPKSEIGKFFFSNFEEYVAVIEPVIGFLQNKNHSLASRIVGRMYLPEGPRFEIVHDDEEAIRHFFGDLGIQDQAKYLASLFIDDLADLIKIEVDSEFGLAKYGEKLAASQSTFDPLLKKIKSSKPSLVDRMIDEIVDELHAEYKPDVVGFSLPFPGNVVAGFRMAQKFTEKNPGVLTVMGGGYVNTELRELSDPRVFQIVHALIFDDGEKAFEMLLKHIVDPSKPLLRTMTSEGGTVVKKGFDKQTKDFTSAELPGPSYRGLDFSQYVSMLEMPNPLTRLWTDYKWIKLYAAHGCYWKKCTFCDLSLDYIERYDPVRIEHLLKQMERLSQETGQTGFHFVDEAMPPALMLKLAHEIKVRGLPYTWWGNIRFEKSFSKEVTLTLAQGGCVAVTGGLEVASERVLELIQKGVTLEHAAQVTRNFSEAGIFAHAYLMYGFPSQTIQETVDSLEFVRQLFEEGCIQSGFWHRFSATAHSPVGKNPEAYGIEIVEHKPRRLGYHGLFARNDLEFKDSTGIDHDALGDALRAAMYNFMQGIGIEEDVRSWFRMSVPMPTHPKGMVSSFISATRRSSESRRPKLRLLESVPEKTL